MTLPKHPHMRHYEFMKYLMQREDLVNECTEKLFPFVDKYNCRVDALLDEIEDQINEKSVD